ncbi:Hypothetical predicted protein [Mytilus galloprovincialis]|uniref:Reverse transcriptase/retrotransposon-derived protein RNase H-like domain-containing protein n=1 Tax=Mytilus galloprovincialis TaxID=29158 RepID=A0A8B6EZZ3_MYTGA|nr:Hypothetical predicted protein [Mytilus galloprovincialis]
MLDAGVIQPSMSEWASAPVLIRKKDRGRQLAFDTLKHKLTVAPVLALPNNTDRFILDTDASQNAIGAELIQVQNGRERTIAYEKDRNSSKMCLVPCYNCLEQQCETLATPQAIETTESQTVPDSPNVDCKLDLTASAPILDQLKEDDTWFSTHIDLICLPTTAHIVIHDDTACHVASISQSEGISFKGFQMKKLRQNSQKILTCYCY